MKRHGCKHYHREKELYHLREMYFRHDLPDHVENEIITRIESKYYNKFWKTMMGRNVPKHFRKMLNRERRAKSKSNLRKLIDCREVEFDDNYKDAFWRWW